VLQVLFQDKFQRLEVIPKRVWRELGYRDATLANPAIQKSFQRAMEIGPALLEPVACYDIFQIERVIPTSVKVKSGILFESRDLARRYQGARELAAFVATIGPRLEEQVGKLFNDGELTVASILDAFGSEAVTIIARRVKGLIQDCALSRGYQVMTRYWFCPGYGDWDTREQKKLFALVDGSCIGVRLGEACAMTPVKSYAGVLPVGSQGAKLLDFKEFDRHMDEWWLSTGSQREK